jgi:profilin
MSGWGAYTTALVGTKNVTQAAIVGFDGATWASSDAKGFVVSAGEAKNIVAGFKDATALRAGGLHVAGVKYITLGCDDALISGKKGTGGVVCSKSKKAVVIGVYAADSGIQPGPATVSVTKMAADLMKKGF